MYSAAYSQGNRENFVVPYSRSDNVPRMDVGNRISERMATLEISQAELARRVGVSQPTINALIRGKAAGSKHMHRLAAELETTAAYLVGETDDPRTDVPPPSVVEALADKMDLVIIPEIELGYSMGGGMVHHEYVQKGVVPFQRSWLRSLMRGSFGDLFVARGEGDSMQPTLLDGDFVLIDTAQKAITQQDRIWAVSYGDLGMIKRVRRTPGGAYLLMSDNPLVSAIQCAEDEMYVVGRVVWIGRRL